MGRVPGNPESGPSWRGRPVSLQRERQAGGSPPPAPPGSGDLPPTYRGPDSGGSGPRWGAIIAVVFGLIAGLVLLWGVGLSTELTEEEDARVAAEEEAVTAATQRNRAIQTANSAVERANQEITLRATAEARMGAAEQVAQQEARLRATAEAEMGAAERVAQQEAQLRASAELERQEAEVGAVAAEQLSQREAQLRATAEAQVLGSEAALKDQRVEAEKTLALELARTNTTIKAIATGELKFYIEPLPWYAAEDVEDAVDDIVDSLMGWEPHGAQVSRTSWRFEADVHVRWVRDYGDHILGLAINQTVLHVGLGSTNCADEWQAFDANTVKKILWHEFGHAFGYGHSVDPGNIMFPTTQTRFAVERVVAQHLAAGYAWGFPLCNSGEYLIDLSVEEDSPDFDLVVLRERVSWDDYWDSDFDAYSCGTGSWRSLTRTCTVHDGAYIYIQNHDHDEATQISGQIIQLDDPPWPDMQWDEDAFYYDEETLDYYRDLFAD